MISVDIRLEELKGYKPRLTIRDDFAAFWEDTLEESRKLPVKGERYAVDYPVKEIKVFEIRYEGFKGAVINGWFILPEHAGENSKVPALIYYHGYTRSRGYISDYLKWVIQGYAVLAVDVRGQGGKTPDPAHYSHGGITGWMTKGLLNKYEYYYRNVYMDCIRAIDFLTVQEEIDTDRIGIYGISQGGGLSLAVAALDSRPKFAMPAYPYLCHFKRALEVYQEGPYSEFFEYFRQFDPEMKSEYQVFGTLSYFDGMNLATKIKCPVLMAITLMDKVCPPSTMFAAYNHINSEKSIKIYPYHGHEALPFHDETMFEFAGRYLK